MDRSPEASTPLRTLTLSRTLLKEMVIRCREEWPREACGFVVGRRDRAESLRPVRNVAPEPTQRFVMDPRELLAALVESEAAGRELLAVYHSHPDGPAFPSPVDVEEAYYPGVLHVIVSLAGSSPDVQAFQIDRRRGVVARAPLHVVN